MRERSKFSINISLEECCFFEAAKFPYEVTMRAIASSDLPLYERDANATMHSALLERKWKITVCNLPPMPTAALRNSLVRSCYYRSILLRSTQKRYPTFRMTNLPLWFQNERFVSRSVIRLQIMRMSRHTSITQLTKLSLVFSRNSSRALGEADLYSHSFEFVLCFHICLLYYLYKQTFTERNAAT